MLEIVRTGRETFPNLKTGPHKMKPATLIPPELLTKKQGGRVPAMLAATG